MSTPSPTPDPAPGSAPGSVQGGPLRFGIFLAPFHPAGQNPTLALERDLDLIAHLDALGFDEAWIGEHHSAGFEIIASPEVFIATAAERTRHIRLGTGVSSLPYHHPLMLADRMVLLSHLTRGRVMLGVGPGALPSDAHMMGIEVARQRDMMEEALEAILLLLRGDEPVTCKTDWFELRDARLQLRPYRGELEVAVAAMVSPSGPRAAGRFGCSLLSLGATQAAGFDALGYHWGVMEERAAAFGTTADRSGWRLVGPMHLAETREQAARDVAFGLPDWVTYFQKIAALPIAPEAADPDALVEAVNSTGFGVIGTPDDAIAQIERLAAQSGGFGAYLLMAHEWADTAQTRRSYELFARYVAPRFQGSAASLTASRDWAAENRPQFIGATTEAIMAKVQQHADESGGTPGE
ncbi:LLM class flavin-dependent oxidoreductase [Actinomadura rudentiformis]|uniref:LLM class flavin-dependent oxidoreductase n=1 Tax=Actinomadura rudentiformis TaxID=359158 RepID=A0A6H9YYD9_9ACTN|nr:LLM class flavin-dependent oxidoreductase [Actinomadura rudentiformis]KAB2349152.1 LLM class flavin-dependent oxidoreductase [Actinomadura rudentiformis]